MKDATLLTAPYSMAAMLARSRKRHASLGPAVGTL